MARPRRAAGSVLGPGDCANLSTTAAESRPVGVGDAAPDFSLHDQHGRLVRFSELRRRDGGDAPTVLYFYPRNFTPACTKEACDFRDAYEDFAEAGAVVVGVSADSAESHRSFSQTFRLPFTLLSDADGAVRRLYGVPSTLGLFAGRVTYVIDRAGIVRLVFNSQLRPGAHIRRAMAALRTMEA